MDRTVRVGIITGIVASMIFVYFLDPIIRIFGEGVFYVSNHLISGLVDSFYRECALGVPHDPALGIYSFLVGILVGIPAAAITAILRDSPLATAPEKERKPRVLWVVIFFATILPLMLFYQFWATLFEYEVITSFDQHIRIVTPYITADAKVLLLSEFAQMEGERDYKDIYEQLHHIASQNDLVLPENPSYGLCAM